MRRTSKYAEQLARGHGGKGYTVAAAGANAAATPTRLAAHGAAFRSLLPTYPYGITLLVCAGLGLSWGFQHNSLSYDYLESPLYFEVISKMYGRAVLEAAFAVAAATPQIALADSSASGGLPSPGGSGQPCPSGPGRVSNPAAVVAALSVAVSGAREARAHGGWEAGGNSTEAAALTRRAVEAAARASGGGGTFGGTGVPGDPDGFSYRQMVQYCPEWATGYIALIAAHYWMGAVGTALAAPLVYRGGARWPILCGGLLFSVLHVAMAMFPGVDSYFYLRAAADIALAATKLPAIVALAEVARPWNRGRVLAALLATFSAGYCAALFMWEASPRPLLKQMALQSADGESGDDIWRTVHLTNAALMFPFALAAPLMPDTPASLMRRGRVVRAYEALRKLRGVRAGLWPQAPRPAGASAGARRGLSSRLPVAPGRAQRLAAGAAAPPPSATMPPHALPHPVAEGDEEAALSAEAGKGPEGGGRAAATASAAAAAASSSAAAAAAAPAGPAAAAAALVQQRHQHEQHNQQQLQQPQLQPPTPPPAQQPQIGVIVRLGSGPGGSGALARDAVDAEFETLMAALAAARAAPACDALGGALGRGCFGAATGTRGERRRAARLQEHPTPPKQQRQGPLASFFSFLGPRPRRPGSFPDAESLPVAMAVAGVPPAAAAMLSPPRPVVAAAADAESGNGGGGGALAADAASASAAAATAAAAAGGEPGGGCANAAADDGIAAASAAAGGAAAAPPQPSSSSAPPAAPPLPPSAASVFDAPLRATFFSKMCRPGLVAGLICGGAYGATGAPIGRFILPVMVRAVPTLSDCGDVPARVVEASTLAPLIVLGASACLLLIDRVGRRGWFLLTGGVLLAMNLLCGSLLAVGEAKRDELHGRIANVSGEDLDIIRRRFHALMGWIPVAALAALALFNAFFFVGWYHLSFTIPAELQPLTTRVHAVAAAIFAQQLGAGIIELFGPAMLCELRAATFFYLALTVGGVLALFAWLVPEPNGLPLEEVQARAFGPHRVWVGCVLGEEAAAADRQARLAARGGPGPVARLFCGARGGGGGGGKGGGGGGSGKAGGGVKKKKGALAAWWARRRKAAAWRRAVRAYRHHQGPPLPSHGAHGAGLAAAASGLGGGALGVGGGNGGGGRRQAGPAAGGAAITTAAAAAAPMGPRGPTPPRRSRGGGGGRSSSGGGGRGRGGSGGGAVAIAIPPPPPPLPLSPPSSPLPQQQQQQRPRPPR